MTPFSRPRFLDLFPVRTLNKRDPDTDPLPYRVAQKADFPARSGFVLAKCRVARSNQERLEGRATPFLRLFQALYDNRSLPGKML